MVSLYSGSHPQRQAEVIDDIRGVAKRYPKSRACLYLTMVISSIQLNLFTASRGISMITVVCYTTRGICTYETKLHRQKYLDQP